MESNEKEYLINLFNGGLSAAKLAKRYEQDYGKPLSLQRLKHLIEKWRNEGINIRSGKRDFCSPGCAEWLLSNCSYYTLYGLESKAKELFNETLNRNSLDGWLRRKGYKAKMDRKENHVSIEKPLGSECTKRDGTTYIKVKSCSDSGEIGEHDRWNDTWMPKARYMYEQYHSTTVPPDMVVIHLNRNKKDYSKENLYAVGRKIFPLVCKYRMRTEDIELSKAGILAVQLQMLVKK